MIAILKFFLITLAICSTLFTTVHYYDGYELNLTLIVESTIGASVITTGMTVIFAIIAVLR